MSIRQDRQAVSRRASASCAAVQPREGSGGRRRRTMSKPFTTGKNGQKEVTQKNPGVPIPLENTWTFWFNGRSGQGMQEIDYKSSMVSLGSFHTVQDFWRYWNNIEPWKFQIFSNLRLFKSGITPTWEDKANAKGGRWVMQFEKENSHMYLGKLVLAVIGEQFPHSEELCGMVYQVKKYHNVLSLWCGSGGPENYIEDMICQLRGILSLPPSVSVAFIFHQGSITWNNKGNCAKGAKRNQVLSRLTSSAPDPNNKRNNSRSMNSVSPVQGSVPGKKKRMSSTTPTEETSPSQEFLPRNFSKGLTKKIKSIRSRDNLETLEAQTIQCETKEPKGPKDEAPLVERERIVGASSGGIKGGRGMACVVASVATAFLAAIAAVVVKVPIEVGVL